MTTCVVLLCKFETTLNVRLLDSYEAGSWIGDIFQNFLNVVQFIIFTYCDTAIQRAVNWHGKHGFVFLLCR